MTISHNIVQKLIQSDITRIENNDNLKFDDLVIHDQLSPEQRKLERTMKKLSSQESAFKIAKLEYEKKEHRLINLTNYNQQSLDQLYTENNLLLRDINEEKVIEAIESRQIDSIIENIKESIVIISRDIDVCYERIELLSKIWKDVSDELYDRIKSFEFRGLKVVSSNLRVKLIPVLNEYKEELKDSELVEESLSRTDIDIHLQEMVNQAREDIYGDLTDDQIQLLEEINPELSVEELVKIISTESIRSDLIVLLETDKIDIKMKKVIDRLI